MNTKKLLKYAAYASAAYFIYTKFLAPSSVAGLGYGWPYGGNIGQDGPGNWYDPSGGVSPGSGNPIMWQNPPPHLRTHRHYGGYPPSNYPGYSGYGYGANNPYYNPVFIEHDPSIASTNAMLDAMEGGN